jgi:hypothetical protein
MLFRRRYQTKHACVCGGLSGYVATEGCFDEMVYVRAMGNEFYEGSEFE